MLCTARNGPRRHGDGQARGGVISRRFDALGRGSVGAFERRGARRRHPPGYGVPVGDGTPPRPPRTKCWCCPPAVPLSGRRRHSRGGGGRRNDGAAIAATHLGGRRPKGLSGSAATGGGRRRTLGAPTSVPPTVSTGGAHGADSIIGSCAYCCPPACNCREAGSVGVAAAVAYVAMVATRPLQTRGCAVRRRRHGLRRRRQRPSVVSRAASAWHPHRSFRV